jgi:hypothetical protein
MYWVAPSSMAAMPAAVTGGRNWVAPSSPGTLTTGGMYCVAPSSAGGSGALGNAVAATGRGAEDGGRGAPEPEPEAPYPYP